MEQDNAHMKTLRSRAEAILQRQPEQVKDLNAQQLRQVLHELQVHQIELEIQNEELRNTQKALADARTRYMKLYNKAPVGYVVLDSSGIIRQTNETFATMLKLSPQTLKGKALAEFMVREDESLFRSRLKAFFKNPDGKHMEVQFQTASSWAFFGSLQTATIRGDRDVPDALETDALLIAITDITLRKRLEARLEHARKMETVSTLAGGIAHDYNNLLSAIIGNLELLREEAGYQSPAIGFLNEAEKASYKARDLTQEFMILSKGGLITREKTDLGDLLQRVLREMSSHSGIGIETNLAEDLRPVDCNAAHLHTAFGNVLKNAVESMPEGGIVNIDACNFSIKEFDENPEVPLRPGDYVRITVQDQGVGIPGNILKKIFDPYFSTKEMGPQKGMGLGLATTHAIIRKHDGLIEARSKLGEGTRIIIYLPAKPEKDVFHAAPVERDAPLATIHRVLVMDDEEMLINLAKLMLKSLSIEAEGVSEGTEAIRVYGEAMNSKTPFDAVILDLTIKGGMGGHETIQELLKLDPDVRAIVSSGYFNDPVMADFKRYGFRAALPKPYQRKDLKNSLKMLF